MSLPAAEERALTRIEQALLARDPRLKSIFSIFTRLTRTEAMPATERLEPRHWQLRSAPVIAIVLALIVGVIVASSLTAPARGCGTAQPTLGVPAQTTATSTGKAGAGSGASHGCSAGTTSRNP